MTLFKMKVDLFLLLKVLKSILVVFRASFPILCFLFLVSASSLGIYFSVLLLLSIFFLSNFSSLDYFYLEALYFVDNFPPNCSVIYILAFFIFWRHWPYYFFTLEVSSFVFLPLYCYLSYVVVLFDIWIVFEFSYFFAS